MPIDSSFINQVVALSIDGVIIPNIINTVKIEGPMYTDFIPNNIKTVKTTCDQHHTNYLNTVIYTKTQKDGAYVVDPNCTHFSNKLIGIDVSSTTYCTQIISR